MPTALSTLADDLLTLTVDRLSAPPARRFVAHGAFAHDCDLVAVHLAGIDLEAAADGNCAYYPTATYVVTVLRCYPTADGETPPPAADLSAASAVLQDDAYALIVGMTNAFIAGTLSDVDCDRLAIAPGLEPVGPSGGIAGWRLRLAIGF